MYSKRYGCLYAISRATAGRCHLCHQPASLEFYGRPGAFGDTTATIDHLEAQAHGGDDRRGNLRLAHATCNAARGTRPFEDVRLALANATAAPLGAASRALIGSAVTGGVAGFVFRGEDEAFNGKAATLAFGLARAAITLAS